ncbi:MAG TPA: galactose-1-phosphate uridylyltransferase [Labilithrix sp.]|nr:galactose-1-phosphate uridylyltransferase [Labilithrix sp.]
MSSLGSAPHAPPFWRQTLTKPDGRALWLYSREPLRCEVTAPAPPGDVPVPNPHLRWHPLRGEWVPYAGHRQHRTFLPPPEYDPLAPTTDPANPTEVPAGDWEVAVFENRFPTLHRDAHSPPAESVPTLPARGQCEVVVYTQAAEGSLGALPLWHVELVLRAWADRTRELGMREDVSYVMPFENRGVEVGVTLPHPHGQLYAYPFVPPVPARELELQRAHFEREHSGLVASIVGAELAHRKRILSEAPSALAFVPVFARYAYEIWVLPVRPAPSLVDLSDHEFEDFARVLKASLMKLDALWDEAMPYILALHQAPTDDRPHPEAHVHVEIYPMRRMKNRLKYLAGSEIGAGTFTADTLPDDKAAELRDVHVVLT